MAWLFDTSIFSIVGSDSVIIPGATLSFYEVGTSTPLATYADSDLTVPNSNPVVSDSSARFPAIWMQELAYKVILKHSDGTVLQTLQEVQSPIYGSTANLISYSQSSTYSADTVGRKLQEQVSVEDFRTAEGAAGDLAAFNAAMLANAKRVIMPRSTYAITGAVIPSTSAVEEIVGFNTVITVTAASGAFGIWVRKPQFLATNGIKLVSTGSKTDGLGTIGIKWDAGASYQTVNVKTQGFSASGLKPIQCVNFTFDGCDASGNTKWIDAQPSGGLPCSAVRILGGYVSGCTDGVSSVNGLTAFEIDGTIFEYCGNSAAPGNAAINITGGIGVVRSAYFEANYQNEIYTDCLVARITPNELTATYASSFTWSGVAFSDRGYSLLTNRALTISSIIGDPTTGGSIRHVGPVSVAGPSTAEFDPASGMTAHYKAGEVRVRYEGVTSGKTWETIVGGGGVGSSGWLSIYDTTDATVRLEIEPGTGTAGIRGSGASMQFWLNGSRVLATRQAAITAPSGGVTVDSQSRTAISSIITALQAHGLIA